MTDNDLPQIITWDEFPLYGVNDGLLVLVLDTYTDEGIRTWLTAWLHADPDTRHIMRMALLAQV